MTRLCELYPGICLKNEEKAQKILSQVIFFIVKLILIYLLTASGLHLIVTISEFGGFVFRSILKSMSYLSILKCWKTSTANVTGNANDLYCKRHCTV
jgi:hypothetical protein